MSNRYLGGYVTGGSFNPFATYIDYLVVAGGGGGVDGGGGGGGAGGLLTGTNLYIGAGTYNITVGGGGSGAANGSNSIFSALTAVGGGRGGYGDGATAPASGGSDGGVRRSSCGL